MTRLVAVARYAWAFPATAVGLVLGLFALAFGAQAAILEGAIEISGGALVRVMALLPRSLRFDAVTLGHVILGVDGAALAACRDHERVHVRQYERWGVLFFPLYIGSSLWQLVIGRSPYRDNCFERQAFREAAEPTGDSSHRRFKGRP